MYSLQSLLLGSNAQFLSNKQSPRALGSKLCLRLYCGNQFEKIEFILFLEMLFSNENVKISWDLKLEMSIEIRISNPNITNICCFLTSLMGVPNKKNRATAPRTVTTTITEMLNIIYYNNIKFKRFSMNNDLQQKIRKYRDNKNLKQSFHDTVEQKRKKLKELTLDNYEENQSITSAKDNQKIKQTSKTSQVKPTSTDTFMDFKHRRYIETTKQLMQAKSKLTQVTHQCEDIKTEVYFEEKKINQIRDYMKRQYQQEEQLLAKKANKFELQKKQKVKMYQDRISKNIEHIEQLLKEKQQQNEKKVKFLEKKKKFQQVKKKTKEKFQEQLKVLKSKWIEEEKIKKEQWQKAKLEEIQGRTLRNLQPQIQRIVQRGKEEINKIRQKYQGMIDQFKKAADEQFEKSVRAIRQGQSAQLQQQRNVIIQQNNKKLRDQAQQLEKQFEQERVKAKNDYHQEIKALQHNRRVESDEYIRKNRYFYVENLEQIKRIKDEYQIKIHQLDGILMKEVDEREAILIQRNRKKIQQIKEAQRMKLKKKMQEYDKKIKSQIENNIEKLSQQIAVENAVYERKIAKDIEQKLKEERQSSQIETKQLKKSILAIQNKIQTLKKDRLSLKEQKQEHETNYLQSKNEYEYLLKKLQQTNLEVEDAKVSQSSVEGRKQQRREEIQQMWQKQISSIKQSLTIAEQQIKTAVDVMKEKQNQLIRETNQAIKQVQKHSNNIIKQKQMQQQALLVKIEHEQKQRQNLKSILRKQIQMMKAYKIN